MSLRAHIRHYRQSRCLFLLIGLVFLLTVHSFLGSMAMVARTTVVTFTVVILVGGMVAVRAERRNVWIALLLGLPTFFTAAVDVMIDSAPLSIVMALTGTAFFIFVTVAVLKYVVSDGPVTADRLFGAACAYLLIGITWAMIYAFVATLEGTAFRYTGGEFLADTAWPDLLYYSFATLTTLGYGDILPVSSGARSLAALESVTGVLYSAMLIARLVALYSAGQKRLAERPDDSP